MKRLTSLILSAALVLSCCAALLCSCSDGGAQNGTTNTSQNTERTNGMNSKQAVDSNITKNKSPKYSFIGNSLTFYGETDRLFDELLAANGYSSTRYSFLESGYSLDTHACDYVLNINNAKNDMDNGFADTDIVIMQDYGTYLTPYERYSVIFSKLNKNAKVYFFQTHYNTGIYHSIVYDEDWDSSDDSGLIGLWRKYIRGEALTEEQILTLCEACYQPKADEYCKNLNYYTIPAGYVLDKLIIEKSADEPELNLNKLIREDDRTHPTDLLAYINALTFYYVIYGEVPIKKDALYYYTENDPTDKLVDTIKDSIKEAVNEYFSGSTFEQRFIKEYKKYISPLENDSDTKYNVPQTVLDKHKNMDFATYAHLKGNMFFKDMNREIVADYMNTTDKDIAQMSEEDINKRLNDMSEIKTDYLYGGERDKFYTSDTEYEPQ